MTFIVYFAIGIWHGASFKYIVYGLWNGGIITASLLLEPVWIHLKAKLHIPSKSKWLAIWQVLRTNFLVFIGRYITRAPRFLVAVEMLQLTVTTFSFQGLLNGKLLMLGLTLQDILIVLIGTFFLLFVEAKEEQGKSVRTSLGKKNFFVQWGVMLAVLFVLFVFGINRGDYIASEFIYKQF